MWVPEQRRVRDTGMVLKLRSWLAFRGRLEMLQFPFGGKSEDTSLGPAFVVDQSAQNSQLGRNPANARLSLLTHL